MLGSCISQIRQGACLSTSSDVRLVLQQYFPEPEASPKLQLCHWTGLRNVDVYGTRLVCPSKTRGFRHTRLAVVRLSWSRMRAMFSNDTAITKDQRAIHVHVLSHRRVSRCDICPLWLVVRVLGTWLEWSHASRQFCGEVLSLCEQRSTVSLVSLLPRSPSEIWCRYVSTQRE